MVNQRSLEALRAFVEGGSVSEAAIRLGRTQPQVGRLLAQLEEALGFAIFTRHNRRLSLTAQGAQFYDRAERVLAGHDGLQRLAAEIRLGQRDAHVRVLTAPQVISALMGEALVTMAREVPGFTAAIESRVRLDIENWVGQEHFDLGITVLPLAHPALEVEEFCRVEAVAVMAPGHPLARRAAITLPDLFGMDLIMTHPRSLIRQQVEQRFRDAGHTPRLRFETASGGMACQLAGLGLGLAIADPFVARSSGAAGLVMRRFEPGLPLPYGMLFPAWQPRSATVQRLAGLIAEAGRQQVAALTRTLRRAGRG